MRVIEININDDGYVSSYEKFIAIQNENEATCLVFNLPDIYKKDGCYQYVAFTLPDGTIKVRSMIDYECVIDSEITSQRGVLLFTVVIKSVPNVLDIETGFIMSSQPISGYIKKIILDETGTNSIDKNVRIYLDEFDSLLMEIRQSSGSIKNLTSDYMSTIKGLLNKYNDLCDDLNKKIANITNNATDMAEVIEARDDFDTLGLRLNEFKHIISSVSVKLFGAKGNGITDDTKAINKAINYCKVNNISTLVIPDGTYVISEELLIDFSNFTLKGTKNAILKYVGDGIDGNIIKIIGNNADDYISNIDISEINIDGTNQLYKGGYSMDTPKLTHPDPLYRGLVAINGKFIKNLTIKDCIINDVYGDGIAIYNSANINVFNNKLYDVSSGNITINGQQGYDNHGDGIVAFMSYNVIFENNTVINKRKYLAETSEIQCLNKPCGRSGLEFEYRINQDYIDSSDDINHNAPDYILIPTEIDENNKEYRDGFGLRAINNYIYGYTKAVHIEAQVKTIIKNNICVFNHIGIMNTTRSETIISHNYFNTFGLGKSPQKGYDAYYGGVAISEYTSKETSVGSIVNNNIFEGDGNGVTIGRHYVSISNNVFNCKRGIHTVVSRVHDLFINNNTFKNVYSDGMPIFLYRAYNCYIKNNEMYSKLPVATDITGHDINIISNTFNNIFIFSKAGEENFTINNNTFNYDDDVESPSENACIYIAKPKKLSLINNKFNFKGNNELMAFNIYGNITCSLISSNVIDVDSSRTKELFNFQSLSKSSLQDNIIYGNGYDLTVFKSYATSDCVIKNNKCENPIKNFFHEINSFWGVHIIMNNDGEIFSTGYYPNTSPTTMINHYLARGTHYYKYNLDTNPNVIGYVSTNGGYYVTKVWSSAIYDVGAMIKNSNGNVYKCVVKGQNDSSNEPTHTTSENNSYDDGYVWKYLGSVANIKELTL